MKPNSEKYNPDPIYLRSLVEQSGLSQRKAAKVIGVSERVMRNYLSLNPNDHTKCPYPVQYCLECLAKIKKTHSPSLRLQAIKNRLQVNASGLDRKLSHNPNQY